MTGLAPASRPPTTAPGRPGNPYKFLDYFEESDEAAFAGRDQDIAEVVSKVCARRTLVLFGRSGLGKTSLLKAGVFPKLRDRGYHPVYVRTLTDPSADLRAALLAEAGALGIEPPPGGAEAGFGPLVASLTLGRTLVIVLDQFEELFTLFRKEDRARNAFIDALADLVDDHELRLRVVFSLREDYLAELEAFRRRLPRLLENRYRLGPLTVFGAREAIVRPLKQGGIAYSQALTTRLLDLLAEDGFDPPMLQIVCHGVYDAAYDRAAAASTDSALRLDVQDLVKVGGLEGIFGRHLDAVTKRIPKEELLLTRMILDALITQEGTKRAVTAGSLASSGRFAVSVEEVGPILRSLERYGLLRRERRGEDDWFELVHEKLVEYVSSWVILDRTFTKFKAAYNLIANGSSDGNWRTEPDALLNRGQIDGVIGPFRDRLKLDPGQVEYLAHGAIFGGSEAAAYWSDRLGGGKGVEVLLWALGDRDRAYRLGAAQVAGQFADPDGRITEAAMALALAEDPEIEVRRAIGLSLADLRKASRQARAAVDRPTSGTGLRMAISRADLRDPGRLARLLAAVSAAVQGLLELPATIRRRGPVAVICGAAWGLASLAVGWARWLFGLPSWAYRELFTTRPLIETIAALAEKGDPLEGFNVWHRLKARRLAMRRLRERSKDLIRAQSLAGASRGALAGVTWVLPAWFFFYPFPSGPSGSLNYSTPTYSPFEFWYPFCYFMFLGAFVGWALSRFARPYQPEGRPAVRGRARPSAAIGLGAIGGIAAWMVMGFIVGTRSNLTQIVSDLGAKVVAVATCGGLLGGCVGWIAANMAAPEILTDDARWRPLRPLFRSWLAALACFLFGVSFAALLVMTRPLGQDGSFLPDFVLLPAVTLMGMIAASVATETTVHLACRSAGRPGPLGRWAWPIVAAVALPRLIYFVLVYLEAIDRPFKWNPSSSLYVSGVARRMTDFVVVILYVRSYVALVAAVARIAAARSHSISPTLEPSIPTAWKARIWVLGAVLLDLLASLATFL